MAKGAGNVNVLVGLLSPLVNNNCFVPDAPKEGSFLLSLLDAPGVFPINLNIHRENTSPFRPTEIHRHVDILHPFSGNLRREL